MSQVHKEQLSAVDNALPNRSSLDVEIFGMEGVPEDIIQSHNQRVMTQFQQAEAERQAVTGNPPPGSGTGQPSAKKPKVESVSDMKKRLAEHRAKRAEALNGSSAEGTPVGAGQTSTPGAFVSFPPLVQEVIILTCQGQSPQSPAVANQQFSYPQPYGGGTAPATANQPYQQTASPVYQNFSPGGQPQFPAQYTPSGYSPQPFQAGTPGQPLPGYGATPSPFPQQPQPQVPQNTVSPQTTPGFTPRSGSLPTAPSLPQRPSFGAPQVNSYQMQQMHMGHPVSTPPGAPSADKTPTPGAAQVSASIDDLVSGAAKEADQTPKPAEATEEKPAKKDKSKQTRLVYSDNEVSPEEKMAGLPRYAFVPNRQGETTVETVPPSTIVGTIRDSDNTTLDPTD